MEKIVWISLVALVIGALVFFMVPKKTPVEDLAADKLYKIVVFDGFDPKKESITLSPLDIESGYIHAALGKEQVIKVLNNFFGSESRVVILELDKQKLNQAGLEVRLEQNKPGGTSYPHLYGMMKLPVNTVTRVIDAKKQAGDVWAFEERA